MEHLIEFFRSDYMPHGHCYYWQPGILWMNVFSDLLIAVAYFSIPFFLVYLIQKKEGVKFQAIFLLFAAFILLCGITHLISIYTIWHGAYGIHGISKALTAFVSITTVITLVCLRKTILSIPTHGELEEAVSSAKSANEAKTKFLACMSHEIRTPINSVIGMITLAMRRAKDSDQKTKLKAAYDSSNSLLNIINDILDFSKVEAGKISIEHTPFNLESVVISAARAFNVQREEKELDLIVDLTEVPFSEFVGDPNRIKQILNNLISNALKFTRFGSVTIKGSISDVDGTPEIAPSLSAPMVKLKLEVIDTGIGIPPDKLSGLFDVFTQADSSTTRKYGGTGLGLSISKQLAQLMNGDITVVSTENRGSRFIVELELSRLTSLDQQSPAPKASTLSTDFIPGNNMLLMSKCTISAKLIKHAIEPLEINFQIVTSLDALIATVSALHLESDQETLDCPILLDANTLCKSMRNYFGRQGSGGENLLNLLQPLRSAHANVWLINYANHDMDLIDNLLSTYSFIQLLERPIAIAEIVSIVRYRQLPQDNLLSLRDHNVPRASLNSTLHFEGESSEAKLEDKLGNNNNKSEQSELRQSSPSTQRPDGPLNILIVEDNKMNQAVIEGFLDDLGANFQIANNGIEALCLLNESLTQKSLFQGVLMDCQMPEMDGYTATRAIREGQAGEFYQNIPISAMTANVMEQDQAKCMESGMNLFIPKPLDPADLEHFTEMLKKRA